MKIIDERFSKFAKILCPLDVRVDSSASFVRKLFSKSVDEYNGAVKNLPEWATEKMSFSPFEDLTDDSLTRYYNGRTNISRALCKKIVPYLNAENFKQYFDSLNVTDEIETTLVNFLKSINSYSEEENISDIFCKYFINTMPI